MKKNIVLDDKRNINLITNVVIQISIQFNFMVWFSSGLSKVRQEERVGRSLPSAPPKVLFKTWSCRNESPEIDIAEGRWLKKGVKIIRFGGWRETQLWKALTPREKPCALSTRLCFKLLPGFPGPRSTACLTGVAGPILSECIPPRCCVCLRVSGRERERERHKHCNSSLMNI